MGSQIKDRQTIKSARKTGRPSQDWFSSRGEFSRSVVGQSEAKPKQLRIIFRHSIEKDYRNIQLDLDGQIYSSFGFVRWTRFISFGLQRINVRNPERTDFAREPNWLLLISCFFTVPVDFPHMVKLYFARPNKGLKLHLCKRDQWKPRIGVMC